MKKILHTIETRGPGGAEILLNNIANELHKRSFTNHGLFIKQGWIFEKFKENNYGAQCDSINSLFDIQFYKKFIKALKENQINIIHAHEFALSLISTIISKIIDVKVVSTIHGLNYHCDTFFRRMMMRFIANNSSLVTVSYKVKQYIVSKAKIDPDKIHVIENGVMIPDLKNVSPRLKQELGLNEDDTLIGTVGRLHDVKGHKYLIEAAQTLCQKNNNLYFVISGEGAERDKLEDQIEKSGLSEKFFLLGNRNDMDNVFSSLDIFILPSLSEGTSLALLEAMSYRLPVIATNVGSNPKLIVNKDNGIIIKSKNPQEIISSISKMMRSTLLKNKSDGNRECVLNNYSFETMIDKYIQLYSKQN